MIEVAIYKTHPQVVRTENDGQDNVTCYDANDNIVTIDDAVVATKHAELQSERNLEELREERNKLLVDTDYWDASDTPAMSQAQIDYRQALRDITDTYTSLDTVVWPTKP
jgi:hypothetical protein